MKMIPVESSNIKSVGYDEITKTLYVEYFTGLYVYLDVSKELFDQLLSAESKGRFVNSQIKNKFVCRRV